MNLRSVKRVNGSSLSLEWSDGHNEVVTLLALRDGCPCAGCKGETVLFQEYKPPAPDTSAPGRYALSEVSPVGNYALKLSWEDGHSLGLYTYAYLRSLCECDVCGGKKQNV